MKNNKLTLKALKEELELLKSSRTQGVSSRRGDLLNPIYYNMPFIYLSSYY
jgi:hypothetical protein